MLIPRLNFIDLKQWTIKIDTITDTASHGAINREPNGEKKKRKIESANHNFKWPFESNSQPVSQSLYHIASMSIRCPLCDWYPMNDEAYFSVAGSIHPVYDSHPLKCLPFFLLLRCSTLWRYLAHSLGQYRQRASTDLLNRKSISIKQQQQRARNADTHKIPVCLSMNHNEHKISLHTYSTAVKSIWIITCNLRTSYRHLQQSFCHADVSSVTF